MSGTYSFLPYARQGIANSLQNATGDARGTFSVKLKVQGNSTVDVDEKKIQVYGPGDIIGIDPRVIFKTDPHNWITNFEPNYLAFVEFYDEDFLWRYTPVPPAGHRLNPWIALVVLEANEFKEGKNITGRPLPFFKLNKPETISLFPKADQLWAWAHVQFNGDLTNAESTILANTQAAVDTALDKLQAALNVNPDLAYSRLVCPRKLLPNKTYHAFVIPAYKSGRLAGEGKDAAAIAAAKLDIAWADNSLEYPYYYRWQFNTGAEGDFEYLVRLLKPKVADARVGRRLMDMTKPGANLKWVEDGDADNNMNGLLRLGGALKVPAKALSPAQLAEAQKNENWAVKNYHHPFQLQLSGFLNLADDYDKSPTPQSNADARTNTNLPLDPNQDEDPLITPPIYGRWHAMVERVLRDRNNNPIDHSYNWITELNLDPRFRVPAHFGTRVVQSNQEEYMEAAWEQIGEVINANRQIRYGQFAMAAGAALHTKHLVAANASNPAQTMLLTAPLQKRVLFDKTTVFQTVRESVLPTSFLSMAMRRIARPRGRLVKQIQKQLPDGEVVNLNTVITDVATGKLDPVPPKIYPPGLPSVDDIASGLEPNIPGWLKDLLKKYPWFKYLPLILALLIILLLLLFSVTGVLLGVGIAVAAALIYVWRLFMNGAKALKAADSFKPGNQTPESVDQLPKSSDFKLVPLDDTFTPTTGNADNDDATRFKESLKDMFRLFQFTEQHEPKPIPLKPISLGNVTAVLLDKLQPQKTVPAWTWQYISIPAWIKEQLPETFVEAMAYPRINKPMYIPLKNISNELFLPNIELIEFNSMTILETNQKFIESYMVGLNHEFARELLWREYATDQRGSYFRQFWDVSSALQDPALAGKTEKEKREPYYDIPELHFWRRASKLGQHDHRQPPGSQPKEEVVLVIRGELLKKYPTAVVYAHKAAWTKDNLGKADLSQPRSLMAPDEGDKKEPDRKFVRTPLYQARVEPDIYFFGFDLTVDEASGESNPDVPNDETNAGWFFVIKERPGETRFGLDIPSADAAGEQPVTWNNLHWGNVLAAPEGEGIIDVLKIPTPTLPVRPDSFFAADTESQGEKEQYKDDIQVTWQNDADAANLAYILYQVPMMVCVHTSEMLKQK